MRASRHFAVALSVVSLVAAGCTPRPGANDTKPTPVTSTSSTTSEDPRADLKRTEAELAASRAQNEELRRQLAKQTARTERPPEKAADNLPPANARRGFEVLARERIHEGCISGIAYSPDGKTVASADAFGRVVLSRADDLRQQLTLEALTGEGVQNGTYSLCFSPDGKYLAVGSDDKTVWVWRAEDGKPITRIRGHQESVEHVFFLPDGITGLSFDRQGNCLAWNLDELKAHDGGPTRRMRRAALSADGKTLAWSDGSRTQVGKLATAESAVLEGFADALAITADGSLLAKGSNAYRVELWDTRAENKRWTSPPLPSKVQAITFGPENKRVVSVAANAVSIWDVKTGDERGRYRVRSDDVIGRLALSPDGRTAALANHRGMVVLVGLPD
jgi:WD40 repeat protein